MNKETRYELYKNSVSPGWWPILDKYIPQILELDPDCDLIIKEKYGVLRIQFLSNKISMEKRIEIINAAELESSTVCEYCGQPGKLRTDRCWHETLCDRCAGADHGIRDIAIKAAELRWLNSANNASNEQDESDPEKGALVEDQQMYASLGGALHETYAKVHAIYGPGNNSLHPDWYCAAADLFRQDLTFRIYFTIEADSQIQVEHVERWYFG